MEWFTIYLLVCIEKIGSVFALGWITLFVGTLVLLTCIFCSVVSYDFEETWNSKPITAIKNICKWLIPIAFVFGCIGKLIPSQKDMAIIVGSGLTYQAVTSESGKRVGGKAVELLEAKIDEALKETKPAEKK